MNSWPLFLFAGVRVRHIAEDWSEATAEMRLGRLNRNYVGTHFGGSLYAMTDPFYAILLMHRLGERYLVWDQSASIDYVAPGRGTVRAHFVLPAARVAEIEAAAAGGEKVLPRFDVDVVHAADASLVARVRRTLYVRLKPRHRPADAKAAA
ncbi:MAG TPA: DUF4442 domain-containing protein [Burkholderiales bacterium]